MITEFSEAVIVVTGVTPTISCSGELQAALDVFYARYDLINTRLLPIGVFLGADDITTQTDYLFFNAP